MNELEFKLIAKDDDGRVFFQIGNYLICEHEEGEGIERFYSIKTTERIKGLECDNEFVAEILFYEPFLSDREKGVKPCFRIQTTAYGSMTPDEISRVIDGYCEAVDVVSMLKKRYGLE